MNDSKHKSAARLAYEQTEAYKQSRARTNKKIRDRKKSETGVSTSTLWKRKNPTAWKAARERWWRKRKEKIREVLRAIRETPCVDCGVQYPWYVMEFDHVQPSILAKGLRGINNFSVRSWSQLGRELDRVEIVCANCHRARTWKRKQGMHYPLEYRRGEQNFA